MEYHSNKTECSRTPSPPPASSPSSKANKKTPPHSPMAAGGQGVKISSQAPTAKRLNGMARLEPKGKLSSMSHSNGQYQNEEVGSLSVDKPLKRSKEGVALSNRRIAGPKVVHVNGVSSNKTIRSQPPQHEGGPPSRHQPPQHEGGAPSRHPDPRFEGGSTQLHHQHNVQSRFRNAYPQHLPSALKKPHTNQVPPPGDVTTHPTQGTRMSRGVRASHVPSSNHVSDSMHTSSSRTPKVQFQSEDQHIERPHPQNSYKSGIPMRATKSAQTPHDAPLTGYPRSHMEAVQRRTASNGHVQHPNQYVNSRSGHAHQGMHGGGGVGHTHFHRVSNRNDADMMVGSLV